MEEDIYLGIFFNTCLARDPTRILHFCNPELHVVYTAEYMTSDRAPEPDGESRDAAPGGPRRCRARNRIHLAISSTVPRERSAHARSVPVSYSYDLSC